MRDDLVPNTDVSVDSEPTSQDTFLLDEGLDLLARYRAIGDPQVRLLIRQLMASAANDRHGAE